MVKSLILTTVIAAAVVLPLIKNGQCPSNYYQSGNYCVPMNDNSKEAVPKVGSCPSGFTQSGNYCVRMK